jgi:hypothetical protein
VGFVSSAATAYNTTTATKTLSVTLAIGDILAIIGESFVSTNTLGTPTGGSLTYTLKQSIVAVSGQNNLYLWTTSASATAQTFSISITMAGVANNWGYNALRFNAINAVGASNKGNGSASAPSLSLTTTSANSIVVIGDSDFNGSLTAATYLTTAGTCNEAFHDTSGGGGTFWSAYYPSVGAIGAKTVGMSAPTQTWGLVAVELTQTLVTSLVRKSFVATKGRTRSYFY